MIGRRIRHAMSLLMQTVGIVALVALTVIVCGAASTAIGGSKGEERACMAHLKKLGDALKSYSQEWGDLPPTVRALSPTYVRDLGALSCPAARRHLGPEGIKRWVEKRGTTYDYFHALVQKLSSTPVNKRDLGAPEGQYITWERARKLRGGKLPVLSCGYHDSEPAEGARPLEKAFWVRLVLRLDGTVSRSIKYPDRETDGNLMWYEF